MLTPSENRNTERALVAAGYRVVQLAPTVCCGALDLHDGNLPRGLEFARRNVRALKRSRRRGDRFGGVGMRRGDRVVWRVIEG